jgi:phage-related minor tail protein
VEDESEPVSERIEQPMDNLNEYEYEHESEENPQEEEMNKMMDDNEIDDEDEIVIEKKPKNYDDEFGELSETFENDSEERDFQNKGVSKVTNQGISKEDQNILEALKSNEILKSEILKTESEEIPESKGNIKTEISEQIISDLDEAKHQEEKQDESSENDIKKKILEITKRVKQENQEKLDESNENLTSEMRSKMFESSRSKRKKFDLSKRTGDSDRGSMFSTRSYRNKSDRSSLLERIERSVR